MVKLNGYLKEFSVSLRTCNSNIGPANSQPQGATSGVVATWPINWGDILPLDFAPNATYYVTHRFTPTCGLVRTISTGDVTGLYRSTRSGYFTCNIANRSVVTTDTVPHYSPPSAYPSRIDRTIFSQGFVNTLQAYSPTVLTTAGYDVWVQYMTEPFTFISYSPEKFNAITIALWEVDENLVVTPTPADPYPQLPYEGIHTLTFKLVD